MQEVRGPRWWETFLFWLNLWTPPRGVDPKPPPYKLIGLIVAGLLVVGIPAGLVIGGAIGEEKERTRSAEAIAQDARQKAERRRLIRDQRVVRGEVRLAAGLSGEAAEQALVDGIAAAVAAEARQRVEAGELDTKIRFPEANCRVLPERRPGHLSLECVAITSTVTGAEGENLGHLGYPFMVLASLGDGSYALCKSNPNPGEGASRFGTTPLLSPECSGLDPIPGA